MIDHEQLKEARLDAERRLKERFYSVGDVIREHIREACAAALEGDIHAAVSNAEEASFLERYYLHTSGATDEFRRLLRGEK